MTIIVAGKLIIDAALRDQLVDQSREAVFLARANPACLDFSVSADPVDARRVNIFEIWASRAALQAFRESGPNSEIFSRVEAFDVKEYTL